MQYMSRYASPLGDILLCADDAGLTGLEFTDRLRSVPDPAQEADAPVLREAAAWLDAYFSGRVPDFTPPLHLVGSPFQLAVWQMLPEIPYGRVVSYGALARALAARTGKARMAAQAVGGAVGRNPVSLIVPCHRVIGADGSLTGYGGGLDRKRALLALEKADTRSFFLLK